MPCNHFLQGFFTQISAFVSQTYRVDRGQLTDLLELGGLYSDLEAEFSPKKLNVLTTQMLSPDFLARIRPEEVLISVLSC